MEKIKEDLSNNQNCIFKNHVHSSRMNSNVIEKHNENVLLKIQQENDNFKTNEKHLKKLEYNEYIPQYKLKYQSSTVLNQLVDVQENDVINTQMKEAAIHTSLKNELMLLNNQLNMYQKDKLKLLQEKEQLETEFQNEKIITKELENEMNSTGQMIGALKEFFSALECNYKKNSSDLSCLKNSEDRIYNMHKQLHEVFDTRKAEISKSQEVVTNIEGENDQLTLKTQNFREKVNTLEILYNDKEKIYLSMTEEYNQELNRLQELLNCYKTEEKINEELKCSLKSLCLEDLISERDKKQKEIELSLQSNKQVAEDISNHVRAFTEDKKNKEQEMNKILEGITKNIELINEKEHEIHQLQTKITDCGKSISEIKDENNKIVFDLQKKIEYGQSRLHEANNAIEVEKQFQETYNKNFAFDQDKKQELDGMMEKHINLKDSLKITYNLNMSKLEEIKKMQGELKNKLTENNKLLLILQKENLDVEIAFKREKEQMEKEIDEMEQKYKKDKEEHENQLSVFDSEISTYTRESERVEKERQKKLQQLMQQNVDKLEKLKADYVDNSNKNEEIQNKINRKKHLLSSIKRRKERLSKEVQTIKDGAARKQIKKSSAIDKNKQPNAGILKNLLQNSTFPQKKVTFSTKSDDIYSITSNECQLPEKKITPSSQFDRLFDMLKEDCDKEEPLKKKKM